MSASKFSSDSLDFSSIRLATTITFTAPRLDELPLILWAARLRVVLSPLAKHSWISARRLGVSVSPYHLLQKRVIFHFVSQVPEVLNGFCI